MLFRIHVRPKIVIDIVQMVLLIQAEPLSRKHHASPSVQRVSTDQAHVSRVLRGTTVQEMIYRRRVQIDLRTQLMRLAGAVVAERPTTVTGHATVATPNPVVCVSLMERTPTEPGVDGHVPPQDLVDARAPAQNHAALRSVTRRNQPLKPQQVISTPIHTVDGEHAQGEVLDRVMQ